MFDSTFLYGSIIVCFAVGLVVLIVTRRPTALFYDRRSVQENVENHLLKVGDTHNQVAWCAPGENGFNGVFELRDGRLGVITCRNKRAVIRLLNKGDVKQVQSSKDGFELSVKMSGWTLRKMKLVFDDLSTSTYARNLLSKANALA